MQIKDGATVISGNLTMSGGCATYTSSALTGGNHTLSLIYGGDSNFLATAGGASVILWSKANTTSNVTFAPVSPVGVGSTVQLIGTVTSPATAVTGFVIGGAGNATFQDNFVDIPGCIGLTVTNGQVTCSVTTAVPPLQAPLIGSHNITLNYLNGDPNFGPSTSPAKASRSTTPSTTTTLSSNASSIALGQSVTYTATVLGTPAASGNPTGSVTFYDAGVTPICAAVAVSAANPAIATCTKTYDASVASLGSGTHQITAVYSPTGNFSGSTSGPVSVTVAKPATAIAQPTSSAGTAIVYGTNTTLSAVVSPTTAVPAYAVNTVQFYDNGIPLGGPQTPSSVTGIATFTTVTPLLAGTHTITAQFLGDANYLASPLSPNLGVTVSKATPSPVTLSAPAPAYIVTYGGLLTTGVTNVPLVGAGVIPTGTVTLSSGGIAIATGTLDGAGNYTFTNVTLPGTINSGAGQNLTVTYNGDANYSTASFVSANGLTVNAATSAAVVTSSPISPVAYGQNVNFTVTLTGPGSPANGTISFTVDGNPINATCTAPTAVVTANVGHCVVAATVANGLGAGSHSITVTNFTEANGNHVMGAVTALTPFVVTPPAPQIVITSNQNPSVYGQAVTFTGTVSGPTGAPAPVGQLQFFDGGGNPRRAAARRHHRRQRGDLHPDGAVRQPADADRRHPRHQRHLRGTHSGQRGGPQLQQRHVADPDAPERVAAGGEPRTQPDGQ